MGPVLCKRGGKNKFNSHFFIGTLVWLHFTNNKCLQLSSNQSISAYSSSSSSSNNSSSRWWSNQNINSMGLI
jgi:hypothetical protein